MSACVLVMAGGTGGHVFPALAVADELRRRGVEVVWLGTRRGLEAEVVPKAGIEMEWIAITGLRGNGVLGWLLAPLRLSLAMLQSVVVIMRRRPTAVLGMGGFVSGPGGFVTWLLHKPLLIHEQNAVAGLTNRILSHLAGRVCEAFPGTFAASKKVLAVGNPVRADIAALAAPRQRFSERTGALRLLVLGGSLGAHALNETVPAALALMAQEQRPQVWHQAGQRNIDAARAAYQTHALDGRVDAFIDDMAEAYGWADIVICRSGALTVSELAAAGIGAVLVPFPFAVDDHQTRNGAYLADAGAAVLIQQRSLTAEGLQQLISEFSHDCGSGRERLLMMAEKARALAKVDAAARVADLCLEVSDA
ncbi:MAG TPA: undecaprenyldiphospho-muramoylpentapeptide beta-N-acetylglucosaminyltransferase [Candidatus Tenderia sp.]|nr:undecaprenyldiphospho-muramoylpentapeptide beta-N-acetylglucosaminyltransferase [Candidatus Tenderia sp.]